MIELSFHKAGSGKYRLYINPKTSISEFKWRGEIVVLKYQNEVFVSKTICGQFSYDQEKNTIIGLKGFDLYSLELSELILTLKKTSKNKANGLLCSLERKSNFFLLVVIGVNINLQTNTNINELKNIVRYGNNMRY